MNADCGRVGGELALSVDDERADTDWARVRGEPFPLPLALESVVVDCAVCGDACSVIDWS